MSPEDQHARELVDRSDALRGASVVSVEPLAGDMSTRRFFRVHLKNSAAQSAIFMILSGASGPVGGGDRALTQDDTYVEVGNYLRVHGIRVPLLYADDRARGALLIEDVGTTSLLDVSQDRAKLPQQISSAQGSDPLKSLFAKALAIQKALADLPHDKQVVIFQRRTTPQQRATQIREFLDHYARPRGLSQHDSGVVERLMDEVCARVESHPKQVSHFDYMASNIHILSGGELCLIDFQDMCLDSPARDVVSLLNDRDADSTLGRARQQELLALFMRDINRHTNFPSLYDEYLLLWDFRVAGRFALLSEQRGIARYGAWLPGTVRRLGRTLSRVRASIPHADEALRALQAFSPLIKEGSEDPWGGIR